MQPTHLRTLLVSATAILLVCTDAAAAQPDDGEATAAVRRANSIISGLLKKKVQPGSAQEKALAAEVQRSVQGFLDIDQLGTLALQDHWNGIAAPQRVRFLELLRELISKNYVRGLRANLNYAVTYLGQESRANGTIVVKTMIQAKRKGRPYRVAIDYTVRSSDNNKPRAFDVSTDGVGLVENYRAQFNKIIKKEGIKGLLLRMENKADSM